MLFGDVVAAPVNRGRLPHSPSESHSTAKISLIEPSNNETSY